MSEFHYQEFTIQFSSLQLGGSQYNFNLFADKSTNNCKYIIAKYTLKYYFARIFDTYFNLV